VASNPPYRGVERRDLEKEVEQAMGLAVRMAEERFTTVLKERMVDLQMEIGDHRKASYPHPDSAPSEQIRLLWDERNIQKGERRQLRNLIVVATLLLGILEAVGILLHH
jgi:hypothetical protein